MFVDIFAGTIGGIAVVLVGHPFDTTKTRLQTAPAGFYKSTIDCVRKTWKWEGFGGFYSGIWSPLAGQMFFRAASFTTFHHCVQYQISTTSSNSSQTINHSNIRPSARQLLFSGAATGFVIAFIEAPIDFIKTKLQVQVFERKHNPSYQPKYTSVIECCQYFLKNHGIRSLYQGLSGTIMRNIPANAVFFPERGNKSIRDISLVENMIAGACAGVSYWVGTYPLDVIKAKMQSAEVGYGKSWLATVREIYRIGGIRAFSTGIVPCAMRAVPACATMFTTVDFIRGHLQ